MLNTTQLFPTTRDHHTVDRFSIDDSSYPLYSDLQYHLIHYLYRIFEIIALLSIGTSTQATSGIDEASSYAKSTSTY